MLPSRWHGTTFSVLYSHEPSQKAPIKVHLITFRDTFELISLDWKTSLEQFSAQDIERTEAKKTTAILSMKSDCKFTTIYLNSTPEPCDHIIEALTISPPHSKPDPIHFSANLIIPSIRTTTSIFHRLAIDQLNSFIQLLGSPPTTSPHLVDAIACLYRLRFGAKSNSSLEQNISSLFVDLKRFLIVIWSIGYSQTLQQVDSGSAIFQQKIGQLIIATIQKVATDIGLQCKDLDSGEAEQAIQLIRKSAQDGLNREEENKRSFDPPGTRLLLGPVLVMIGGVVVGMYEFDLKMLAQTIVDYVEVVIDRGGPLDHAKHTLQQKQGLFLRELLCLLDGRRFDDVFQWIYCLWELRAKESTSLMGGK
jgi:hypothetical protein